MSAPKQEKDPWTAMTWAGASLNTLRAGARLSLAEKVAWLEQAHRAVERLKAQAPDRDALPPEESDS